MMLICSQFDDIETIDGTARVPSNYRDLHFKDFDVFKPDDPELDGIVSAFDHNCAASRPNALAGIRFTDDYPRRPRISIHEDSNYTSFTLNSVHIKPWIMPPWSYSTLSLNGTNIRGKNLHWAVDFPYGFHDMFLVKIEEYSGKPWTKLQRLEIRADFVNGEFLEDWSFCLDDLDVTLETS